MKKRTVTALVIGTAAAAATAVITPLLVRDTRTLEATEYTFRSKKVTGALEGYRMSVVADLHGERYGKHNERLLHLLESSMPDIILIPGDLTDSYHDRTEAALEFARAAVKIAPCWFTTGNHEHRLERSELDAFLKGLEDAGVHILRGDAVQMGAGADSFRLLGVDCNQAKDEVLRNLMKDRPENELNILVSHKPNFADNYETSGVDLVVCGHAHGGQFRLPGIGGLYAPEQGILPKYTAGLYKLGKTTMAVSRGAGNSSFPVRLGNKPEIVTIVLRGTKSR